jgi:uncharacterized membrane protein (DUF485 family)
LRRRALIDTDHNEFNQVATRTRRAAIFLLFGSASHPAAPIQEPTMSATARPPDGTKNATELIESPAFRALVKTRWTVSFTLLALLFVGYYGYIILVATRPALMARRLSDAPDAIANLGLVLGIGTLVFAWILTAIYVVWANRAYDPEVERLKNQLKR